MPKGRRFGEIAIEKGYVTESQVERALAVQERVDEEGGEHRLIGLVMLSEGYISTTQLIEMLKIMDAERKLSEEGE